MFDSASVTLVSRAVMSASASATSAAGFRVIYLLVKYPGMVQLYYKINPKCFAMAKEARMHHRILNQIIVGSVFTVEDHIKDMLETKANMYNHQNCLPNSRPGNIIAIFVIKAKNSTVFGLSQ
jgi:hypothetical protein